MSSETQSRTHVNLTKTEVMIVRYILAGSTSAKDIEANYGMHPKTLQTHLRHIYRKTGAYNKADIVLMALGKKAGSIDLAKQLDRWSKQRSI